MGWVGGCCKWGLPTVCHPSAALPVGDDAPAKKALHLRPPTQTRAQYAAPVTTLAAAALTLASLATEARWVLVGADARGAIGWVASRRYAPYILWLGTVSGIVSGLGFEGRGGGCVCVCVCVGGLASAQRGWAGPGQAPRRAPRPTESRQSQPPQPRPPRSATRALTRFSSTCRALSSPWRSS